MTLDEIQGNLSRKYENLKRIMSGLPPILDDVREGVQGMRQGVQNVRQGFQDAVQPSLNAVREGVKNDLGPSTRGVVQGSLEGFPEAAQQIKGSFTPPPPAEDTTATDQLQQALLGLWRPRSSPTEPPPMPEDKPSPQPGMFDASARPGRAGTLAPDYTNGLKGINDQFQKDAAKNSGNRRVANAIAQGQSIEDVLMGKTSNLQGMANRNQRAFNGGGPTPGMTGFNASMQNEADISKQMAARNPMVDPLSPLQMRGEIESPQEDARDMTSEGVEARLRAAFGVRPGQDQEYGRRLEYDSPARRNGKPNPFYSTTTSTVGEDGNVQFRTQYLPQSAADFDQTGPTTAVPGGTSTPATLSDRPAERAREANKELMAQRRGAPAKARLNQLQFTQKQLANALSGKPIDDLPDGLSADAANELVRGSARMYRRGENMKTFQDLLAQGLSPDPNPRVREQFAEGALAAKRGQVDADLRAKLAGEKMQQDASEGEKKRASDERIAKMGADAQIAASQSRGNGDQLENKMVAIGFWKQQLLEAEKRKDGPAIAKAKSRIAELSDPASPNTSEPATRERATPQSQVSAALFGAAPPIVPQSPSATSSPMDLPYIPAPNPNDKRKKSGRQPWMDIDPTFGAATDPFIPNAHEGWLVY